MRHGSSPVMCGRVASVQDMLHQLLLQLPTQPLQLLVQPHQVSTSANL